VFAQDHGYFTAIGRYGGAHVRAAVPGKGPASAGEQVLMKNVHMIKLVRSVVDLFAARYPARGGNDGVVCRRRMWIVAVEIRGENLAIPARIIFEGNLSQGDAFVLRNRVDEIIRESMRLAPQRCAGIGFCNQAALIETIG